MAVNDYVFESHWRSAASREEVAAILADAESLPRWWGDVYLAVEPEGGGVYRVWSRGWLPYTLKWRFVRTRDERPAGFALRAWGDLEGTGEWRFHEDGGIDFIWRVRADKPLLRYLSWLLKPVFAANHRWAMARGERALEHEVLRRRLMNGVRG